MGWNTPEVGEVVVYYVDAERTVFATVTAAIFWDLVDLELEDGTVMRNVRRVLEIIDGGAVRVEMVTGRFRRRGARPP